MRKICIGILLISMLLGAACNAAPEAEAPAPSVAAEQSVHETEIAPTVAPVPTAEPAASEAEAPLTEAAEDAESASRFAPLYAEMQQSGVLPDMMELPAGMVADFYGIDPADCTDGLYYISFDNLLADEIVLVDAADAAAAKRVEKALENRLAAKAQEADGYAPEQYAVIKKCGVVRKGLTVAMIVSPERDTLLELFTKMP